LAEIEFPGRLPEPSAEWFQPVTRGELYVVARSLQLMLLAARNQVVAQIGVEKPEFAKAAEEKFTSLETKFDHELRSMLDGSMFGED
jgi:hypothetical protein